MTRARTSSKPGCDPTNDLLAEAAVEYFASRSHQSWRRQFLKLNPGERGRPRMRLRGGVMVDVNQPWSRLHPKAQIDNRRAAEAAYEAVARFPDDREAAAAHVHQCWIKRNRGDPNQPPHLFKPYAELPEAEKEKDRAHVDAMKRALVAVGAGGGAARTKQAKRNTRPRKRPAAK